MQTRMDLIFFAPDPMSIFRTETIRRRYVGTQKKRFCFYWKPPASVNKNSNNIYIPNIPILYT